MLLPTDLANSTILIERLGITFARTEALSPTIRDPGEGRVKALPQPGDGFRHRLGKVAILTFAIAVTRHLDGLSEKPVPPVESGNIGAFAFRQ